MVLIKASRTSGASPHPAPAPGLSTNFSGRDGRPWREESAERTVSQSDGVGRGKFGKGVWRYVVSCFSFLANEGDGFGSRDDGEESLVSLVEDRRRLAGVVGFGFSSMV